MKYPPHEQRLAATAPQADPAADAVCVCGHLYIDHNNGYKCNEVSLIRNGAKALCGCDGFRPAPATPAAHDVPAAQLRERLAQAERQLKAATNEAEKRGEEVVKYRAEADRLREQVVELTRQIEILTRGHVAWSEECATLLAERDSLGSQLAEAQAATEQATEAFAVTEADNYAYLMELQLQLADAKREAATMHANSDGYAGLLAELIVYRKHFSKAYDMLKAVEK